MEVLVWPDKAALRCQTLGTGRLGPNLLHKAKQAKLRRQTAFSSCSSERELSL